MTIGLASGLSPYRCKAISSNTDDAAKWPMSAWLGLRKLRGDTYPKHIMSEKHNNNNTNNNISQSFITYGNDDADIMDTDSMKL